MTKKIQIALLLLLAWASAAHAQSSPGLVRGQVPTAAQWNNFFAQKQDVFAYTPVNRSGDSMLGPLVTFPSSATAAGFRIPPGTAPTSPVNGDIWTTAAGVFARVNGVTTTLGGGCADLGAFNVGTGSGSQCSTTAGSTAVLNGGPLTINPTVATTTQGFAINQTMAGTGVGTVAANRVTVYDTGVQVTASSTQGTGMVNDFEGYQNVTGLAVNMVANSGGTSTGTRFAGLFQTFMNAPASLTNPLPFYVGGGAITYINSSDGGTVGTRRGISEGFLAASWIEGGVQNWQLSIALESNTGVKAGATVDSKIGILIDTTPLDGASGLVYDAALMFSNAGPVGWKSLIQSSALAGVMPLAADGRFIWANGAQTFQDGIDFSSATITGHFLKSQFFNVLGSGKTAISGTATATPFLVIQQTDGASSTTGSADFTVNSDTAAAVVATHGSARTTVRFGQVSGGWTEFSADTVGGAGTNGILLGTVPNKPIVFGVNNAEVGRITASGLAIAGLTVTGSFTATGLVTSAALNITTTACTNQFVTAISSIGIGTCTTDTLASAQHANQGTTTTVLHGNAAGNPSWAAVSLTADVSGVLPVANGGTGTATGTRTILSASTTFYVRTDGNNANTCLTNSAGGACLTIQGAYNKITANYDLGGQAVTIQIVDGTYTAGVSITQPWTGGGSVTIQGNAATPANVLVGVTSVNAFEVLSPLPGILTIKDLRCTTTTSGDCIFVSVPAAVNYTNMDFGAAAGNHIRTQAPGSRVTCTGSYTISGNAQFHWLATGGSSQIYCQGLPVSAAKTITFTGTPVFIAFAAGFLVSSLVVDGLTFSPATAAFSGKRYDVGSNGVVYTGSGGPNYFPGSILGCTAPCPTGGQYL